MTPPLFHLTLTKQPLTHLEQAYDFRRCMDQPIYSNDQVLAVKAFGLIQEEFAELFEAVLLTVLDCHSAELQLKELADLSYVCYQFAALKGWDLDEALDRVHESNMSKLVNGRPVKNEQGKVLKGPNYQPPTLTDLV